MIILNNMRISYQSILGIIKFYSNLLSKTFINIVGNAKFLSYFIRKRHLRFRDIVSVKVVPRIKQYNWIFFSNYFSIWTPNTNWNCMCV